jgi:uncharacterized protein (TIGR02594 family)
MDEPSTDDRDWCPWLRIAQRFDGQRELGDDGQLSQTVRGFFRATRFPPGLINERTSWCAAFVCTVLDLAGIEHPRSARARDFIAWGTELKQPVRGAVLVFERTIGGKTSENHGHVAICDRDLVSPQQLEVSCIGGNQDNAVCSRRKKLEHLLSARWPRGWPLPPGAEAK